MVLLIDNYDSFSYNLYQLIGSIRQDILVIRNDEKTIKEIEEMNPEYIIISPGPGRPENAGICIDIIKYFKDKVPILGVCLGHQSICSAFGGEITYAKNIVHGKQSKIKIDNTTKLFKRIDETIYVARYHSLIVNKESLPNELKITAITDEDEIMAVEHKKYNVYGVQFHPESIMTKEGQKIIKNFLGE